MRRSLPYCLATAITLIAFTGCSRDSDRNATPESSARRDDRPLTEPQELPDQIELISGDWSDVQAAVAKSVGKVVVVDLWSTSCLPCLKELPYLGQLQRAEPGNVVCISLSVDYSGAKSKPPESYRERVEQALKKCEANVLNYLCTTEADRVFESLQLASIPAVFVYDVDGRLVQRFDASLPGKDSDEEPFTYADDILPLVEKLISAQS